MLCESNLPQKDILLYLRVKIAISYKKNISLLHDFIKNMKSLGKLYLEIY
jgi:hypothetical protein